MKNSKLTTADIYHAYENNGITGYLSARVSAIKRVDPRIIAHVDESLIKELNILRATNEELVAFVISTESSLYGLATLDGEGDVGWDIVTLPQRFVLSRRRAELEKSHKTQEERR
jgi:hypothetical protein